MVAEFPNRLSRQILQHTSAAVQMRFEAGQAARWLAPAIAGSIALPFLFIGVAFDWLTIVLLVLCVLGNLACWGMVLWHAFRAGVHWIDKRALHRKMHAELIEAIQTTPVADGGLEVVDSAMGRE